MSRPYHRTTASQIRWSDTQSSADLCRAPALAQVPHLVAAHVDGGGVGVGVENLIQRGQDEGQRLGEICLERGRYLHDVPKHLVFIFGPPCIHFGRHEASCLGHGGHPLPPPRSQRGAGSRGTWAAPAIPSWIVLGRLLKSRNHEQQGHSQSHRIVG